MSPHDLTDVPPAFIVTKADRYSIDNEGCRWSQWWADRIIAFANNLFSSQFIDGKFALLAWQEHYLRSLYGWRRANGKRRFRTSNLHIAKKNGKTMLVAIIALFELFAAGVKTPRVASGSVTRQNAEQVLDEVKHALDNCELGEWCKYEKSKHRIVVEETGGRFWSLSSEGDSSQGEHLSCAIVDEYHCHENDSLYDSLRYSTTARSGLLVVISTAGDDVLHPYYTLYTKSKNVIKGDDLDTTHLAVVHEADEGCDPEDRTQWRKANPSLGTSFTEEDFALELKAAKSSVGEWMKFLRYKLNQWVRPEEHAFVDVQKWDKLKADPIPSDDFLKKCPAWMGADLSTSIDPSSISLCWLLPDGKYYLKSWAWIGTAGIEDRDKSNLPKYSQFILEKSMVNSGTARIDHIAMLDWMRSRCREFQVKIITFDANNAELVAQTLKNEGKNIEYMPQFPKWWNGPLKEFERCISTGEISHDGSSWARYCCGNVRVKQNDAGELAPSKGKSIDKVDGFQSMVMAFAEAVRHKSKPKAGKIEVWG